MEPRTRTRKAPGTAPTRDGDTETMLPEREVRFSPSVHWSHRRPLGVGPSALLAGTAATMLGVAIILFAVGSWIAGLVFVLIAALEGCLFLVAARREPDARSARAARSAADHADGVVRLVAITARAWSRAGVELARIWESRQRSRIQLRRRLTPLGDAVLRDDPDRAAELKAEAQRFDQAIQESERRAAAVVAARRRQVERERVPTQRTEQLPVVDLPDADGRR